MACQDTVSGLERMLLHETAEPKDLPLSLLEEITNGFSDKLEIGKGGFAVVYKGILGDGTVVAVKKLHSNAYMHEKNFLREVECLMMVKHKNVVRFLGYCDHTQEKEESYNGKFVMASIRERLLCFEYLPKGSLDHYIEDASLGWRKCYQIIKGICEGLHYLHHNHIIHSDLKPANILLDENMLPKIADFGLSRCLDDKQSRFVTAKLAGTLGYMAPELLFSIEITFSFKSDIYSLGVIIIEILTGKKWCPLDDLRKIHEMVLESWTNKLEGDTELKQVGVCTEIARECVDCDPKKRPVTQHIISRFDKTRGMDGFVRTRLSTESTDGFIGTGLSTESTESSSSVAQLEMLNRIATVKDDGTVVVDVLSGLEPGTIGVGAEDGYGEATVEESLYATDIPYRPPMQIVILVVGTREDVQPFVAIGKRLEDFGHRVRLATHANFKEFVLTAGLEFYPLGGDPKILAEYMVKNKGFVPSGPSEIAIQRKQIKEIIFSLLPACKDADPDTGIPFKVDAIIANPPAYGQTHVAEALKVPIHIFSTMPWTPSSEFPHHLSRVKQSAGRRLLYQIVDSTIGLGIRDMINEFRKKKLKLRPVTYLSGAQGSGNDIPHGYIWSPHLVPKPKDWGPKIDVVGFCFLDLASDYVPPESLVKWLEAGDKPIYVGFGSLPVQEPQMMTEIIVKALEITGQRGIINIKKEWGGLGTLAEPKDFVYVLDNCPHDWLFLQCKAVVHHGGAGITAAGLKAACPTTIVPFFGDQPFWGYRVHARGLGPAPIPVDQFGLQKLVDAIKFMMEPEVKEKAVELAKAMESEDGVRGAVRAFLRHLP